MQYADSNYKLEKVLSQKTIGTINIHRLKEFAGNVIFWNKTQLKRLQRSDTKGKESNGTEGDEKWTLILKKKKERNNKYTKTKEITLEDTPHLKI